MNTEMDARLKGIVDKICPEIVELRHHLHQNPELAGEEYQTAAFIRKTLSGTRVRVLKPFLKTDTVGILKGCKPGRNVTLRADIDALPLLEKNTFSHVSKIKGCMHACGHDGNTAVLLGVTKVLEHFTPEFCGTVRFVFQPGEEVAALGKELVAKGALERPRPDMVFALHGLAGAPEGVIFSRPGVMMAAVAVSAPLYVLFGWLSDKVGRKPVMLFGMTLMLIAYFPGFHLLGQMLNPALAQAQAQSPATVIADPADCSLQFDPVGKASFTSSCDIAKSALANAGVSYVNASGAAGQPALVRVGLATIPSLDARGLPKDVAKAVKTSVETKIKEGLARSGYPAKADPKAMNLPGAFGVLMIFVIAATALFGPIASCLVELFPTRIRYTAMSLPYHIGTGWIGGFVPFTAFAIVAAVGNIYAGLWYPFGFTLLSVLTCLFLLPETKGRDLNA